MRISTWPKAFALALSLAWVSPLAAQGGRIIGRVTDAASGRPIADAQVTSRSASAVMTYATTTVNGTFRLEVPAGSYTVSVNAVGFESASAEVRVAEGATASADFSLTAKVVELEEVTVTGTRGRAEKATQAPVDIQVVPQAAIVQRPALTVADHLKAVPGVDISQGGLIQSNIVARGFNNIFSGATLMLLDNRFAAVPSLRVNVPAFFPGTNDDIARVEFVLGPGAALYGPNSANGVLALITKSPLDYPGTTATLEVGHRAGSRAPDPLSKFGTGATKYDDGHAIFRIGTRHAGTVGSKFGYKISAEILDAEEWRAVDPSEPSTLPSRSCNSQFNCRDFDVNKWSADVRLDYRPTDDSEIIASAGRSSSGSLIEYTGIGAAQAQDWANSYGQLRARFGRLFAQVFRNRSNSGSENGTDLSGSFLLRDGNPIVDKSRVTAAQVQHGWAVSDRLDLIYGVDYAYTDARTAGTINGRNEEDDSIKELGGYLHAAFGLTDQLELVGALRVDDHSRLDKAVWSPRAALVFSPTESQSLRATYNRAFSTPSNNNLFLDIVAGRAGPYNVRALGVPAEGFSFRGYCGAGGISDLCMRPGFGLPNQPMPAVAAPLWGVAVAAVAPALGPLGAVLRALPAPSPAQIGTKLRRLDPTAGVFNDIDPTTVRDVEAMQPTITNTYEVGYKGVINNRFRMSLSGWYQRKENFVGPLIVESPSVFLDPAGTLAYLQATFQPAVTGLLIQQGLPAAAAAQQAAVITGQAAAGMAGISGSKLATGVPLGTVVPDGSLTDRPDIFLTYRNFGNVDLWGADLGVDYYFNEVWSVSGTYSLVSDDFFAAADVGGPTDIALNASKSKGTATVRYNNTGNGLSWETRGRFVRGFPVNSGVYISPTLPDGSLKPIDSYGLLDAQISWRPPRSPNWMVTLLVENAMDRNYATFVGVPQLGRLVMTKLQLTF